MSPIKPKGPAVPPSASTKLDDTDQTIAEPPRDFTDEIFQQLTGAPAPPPAAGAPPQAADLEAPRVFNTQPMYNAPRPPIGAAPAPIAAPPPSAPATAPMSAPASAPMSAPQSNPRPEVRVRTPLWAIIYLGIAVLAIAFGLFVLFMQSRVVGHF